MSKYTWHGFLRAGLCAVALLLAQAARSEPGVTSARIVIGMSAPLSGPLSHYGLYLAKGLRFGVEQLNSAGGIAGRRIELLVRDDGGQPDRAVANAQALLDEGVLAFTKFHGASSIAAVLPLIEKSGALLVGAASSAELLRKPPLRQVFNLRAGAHEETAAMVLHLDTVGITEVAAIAQDDALGSAALEGVQVELVRLAIRPQALVRLAVPPSPADVARAVQAACKSKPQALVLGLSAGNALSVIRAARKAGCLSQFYAMSEACAELLASAGEVPGELAGVVVSQVLPHPRTAAGRRAVNTRAGSRYGRNDYVNAGSGMGYEATMCLLERGVRLTGTDAWSWDAPFSYTAKKFARDKRLLWDGHMAGKDIGYCHLEKLHNLEALPGDGFTLCCFPHKIRGASAGWTRAVAIFEDGCAMPVRVQPDRA